MFLFKSLQILFLKRFKDRVNYEQKNIVDFVVHPLSNVMEKALKANSDGFVFNVKEATSGKTRPANITNTWFGSESGFAKVLRSDS